MSESRPVDIPNLKRHSNHENNFSPEGSPGFHGLKLPSPLITRRTRSNSTSERALANPLKVGTIKYFSRSRGHGFITPEDGGTDVFVHISDIEGEYVPRHGDEVRYRICPIPPKNEKFQAVHVQIIHFCPERHTKWASAVLDEDADESPDGETAHAPAGDI